MKVSNSKADLVFEYVKRWKLIVLNYMVTDLHQVIFTDIIFCLAAALFLLSGL